MRIIKRQHIFFFLALLWISTSLISQQTGPENYKNPILPGFHPDPSICRVGEDYYLVNSSFEWYPGLPVYHSRDLVNWELIGHGINRPDQVELQTGLGNSMGVFAPTIRYHKGTFYIINTCVQCKGNFYITATDPEGPWSDPVWLQSPGIDPSLFWDDDGRCYYVGHANISGVYDWPDKQGAWMQELDLKQQKLVGKRVQLTHGHASNAVWAEGPHLYKIDSTYLLLVAEGGTEYNHSVTFFTSDSLWGPYIPNQVNPSITHRHLGQDFPVHSVGHADLVQTQKGDWWSVLLAKRRVDGFTLLARETFLTPVKMEWNSGILTPIYNPGIGQLLPEQKRPDLTWTPVDLPPARDEFNSETLALYWNFLRTPYTKWYELKEGKLHIQLRPEVVEKLVNPSLIVRRIQHHQFTSSLKMDFSSGKSNEQAGLILYRNSKNHFQLMREGKNLVLIKSVNDTREEIARVPYDHNEVILSVTATGLDVVFNYGSSETDLRQIGPIENMNILSDEISGRFNGPYVGMYATSNDLKSESTASFSWFEYSAAPE